MLLTKHNRTQVLKLGIATTLVFGLFSCSSLNQKPYDVDGIYNNSKIVVADTHNKSQYYTEYFKELEESNETFFTDVDSYVSGNYQPNAGWGDSSSDTTFIFNYPYSYWGWHSPYWGGWYNNYWGVGYGFGGYWGLNYGFGWGYPYHYGYYGWGYPYRNYRNISRSNYVRSINDRSLTAHNKLSYNNSRSSINTLSRNTNFNRSSRTFAKATSESTRMSVLNNQLLNNRSELNKNTNRNDRYINSNNTRSNNTRVNTPRMDRSSTNRPTYTPSSNNSRFNNGGNFGGSRSGGSSGGMRTSGGRR